MKSHLLLAAVVAASTGSSTIAASLSAQRTGNTFALFLAGEEHNGAFDTIALDFLPAPGVAFQNIDTGLTGGLPRQPGEPFTFLNRALELDPSEGGEGFAVLGKITIPTRVSFAASPLGQVIDTSTEPGGRLFLANVVLPPGGRATATLQTIRAGTLIQELTFTVPEPATVALTGAGALAMVGLRRRR